MQHTIHGRPQHGTDSAERIVERFQRREVADHPFFESLRAQPVNLPALWILMANLQAGISRPFISWLARTIERVEDRRIASLLSKQLSDELGHGQFDQIHSVLLLRFVDALEAWRPPTADLATLDPGRRLAEGGDAIFADDSMVMVGAIMIGEIFAEKMDRCLGDQVRRQDRIERSALYWLELHEMLEVDHASDSLELAKLVPNTASAVAAVRRGADAQWDLLWRFLDDVQAEADRAQIGTRTIS